MRHAMPGTRRVATVPLLVVLALGCRADGAPDSQGGANTMVPQIAADLRLIRAHRIYFYHHSVGVNVLSGVERLEAEAGGERIAMAWVENGTPRDRGALVHGGGGRNG